MLSRSSIYIPFEKKSMPSSLSYQKIFHGGGGSVINLTSSIMPGKPAVVILSQTERPGE
jgi:hypothetical protein